VIIQQANQQTGKNFMEYCGDLEVR